jgi:uncharacterized repeat protein (TIGR03803 family)
MLRSSSSPIRVVCLATLALAILLNAAAQAQTFHVIHNFTGGADGSTPYAGLTMDRGGNFYGTTGQGGTGTGCFFEQPGCGVVYKLSHSGQSWILSPLHEFPGTSDPNDGDQPWGRVTFGPDGALYGTTLAGGQGTAGTVFRMTPPATSCKSALCYWNENVIYAFQGGFDGQYPLGDLFFDAAGHLFGITENGGVFDNQCEQLTCGVVYEMQNSGQWTETGIYDFNGQAFLPQSGLVSDGAGNLYGTTFSGSGGGTVYQLVPIFGGYSANIIHTLSDGSPFGGLIMDSAGNLYGASQWGGLNGTGFVYELARSGSSWDYTVLYNFPNDNGEPESTLTMDAAGNLYGTTNGDYSRHIYGSVYKLTKSNGIWNYTALHNFTNGSDGGLPMWSGVTFDAAGNLWGTASGGGSGNLGVVWEITP